MTDFKVVSTAFRTWLIDQEVVSKSRINSNNGTLKDSARAFIKRGSCNVGYVKPENDDEQATIDRQTKEGWLRDGHP